MQTRGLADWVTEDEDGAPQARPVDDWTAGDEPDFTVRPRRRITRTSREIVLSAAVPAVPRPLVPAAAGPELQSTTGRLREVEQRQRVSRTPMDRAASRPDRIAMWAVALGFVLILIASISS